MRKRTAQVLVGVNAMRSSEFVNKSTSGKKIVYHGNQGGIDASKLVTPMWFTSSKEDAEHYAGGDGYVVAAKLLCKNPYVIDNKDPNEVLLGWKKLAKEGYDCIHDPRNNDWVPFYSKDIKVVNITDQSQQDFQEGKFAHTVQSIMSTPIDPLDQIDRSEHELKMQTRSAKDYVRGPHEGRILSLMLAKKKPAASVPAEELTSRFRKAIRDGKIKVIGKFPNHDVDEYIVTLPGEEWRGRQLLKLWPLLAKTSDAGDVFAADKIHAKIGVLLGYPKEAVRYFINKRM